MLRKLSSTLCTMALALSMTGVAVANDDKPSVIKSQAMQCYTLYSMLMEEDPVDEYRNHILGSQAMLMGTIYVWSATEEGKELDQEQFDKTSELVKSGLLTFAQQNRDLVAERVIRCEGWREEIISAMALSREEFTDIQTEADIRRVIGSIPAPKESYPLKGVSRMELNLVVDEAVNRHLQE